MQQLMIIINFNLAQNDGWFAFVVITILEIFEFQK